MKVEIPPTDGNREDVSLLGALMMDNFKYRIIL